MLRHLGDKIHIKSYNQRTKKPLLPAIVSWVCANSKSQWSIVQQHIPRKVAINNALPFKAAWCNAIAKLISFWHLTTRMTDSFTTTKLSRASKNLAFLAQFLEENPKFLQHYRSPISPYQLAKFGWHAIHDFDEWRLTNSGFFLGGGNAIPQMISRQEGMVIQ